MKRFSLLLALLFTSGLFSQLDAQKAQRLILWEQFTQASCGPCAATNPTIQALLNANPNKVISIKYQVSWPGFDPMYQDNPVDVNARVGLYGVNSVPYTVLDGTNIGNSPATQGQIDARYAVESPFEITLDHHLSGGNDSIYTTMTITATEDISGNLRAHIVVIEELIDYDTPPGSNGETEFYNVMKKMLPSNQGTTLDNFTAGQSITIEEAWELENVYDIEELAVVAFVQDAGTKEVHQAAYSPKKPLAPTSAADAAILGLANLGETICGNFVAPAVTIKNMGWDNLTSLNFTFDVNGSEPVHYIWTGNVETYETVDVQLPGIFFEPQATNTLNIVAELPNGAPDPTVANSQLEAELDATPVAVSPIMLLLSTDGNANQTSWEVTNSSGEVLYQSGTLQNNTLYTEYFDLTATDCYNFTMYDSEGNGITSPNTAYSLRDANNQILKIGSGDFGFYETTALHTEGSPAAWFYPADGQIEVPVSTPVTLNFTEPVRLLDDSPITDPAALITFKETDENGADVSFTATINDDKTQIMITPDTELDFNQDYYLYIDAVVEDADDNPIEETTAIFTTMELVAPTALFNPADGATDVPLTTNITIVFDQPVRMLDDSPITASNIADVVTLKETDENGADVSFTGEVAVSQNVITLNPDNDLMYNTNYYVAVDGVEGVYDNAVTLSSAVFTTVGAAAPAVTFAPEDGSDNVPVATTVTITFDQEVRLANDSPITDSDIPSIVTFKESDENGADVSFTGTINGDSNEITVTPDAGLASLTTYYVAVGNEIEGIYNNAVPATSVMFTTEEVSGVALVSDALQFSVFPNPANSEINLSFVLQQEAQLTFEVFNTLGELVISESQKQTAGQQQWQLNTAGLANGVYFVKISDGNHSSTEKITINR